jgi:arginine decarboxylase
VTSAHKMLPAYSQAALVLARTERLDPARLQSAFDATHTTSPAGALLASMDAARALLQLAGEAQLDRPVRLVAGARSRLGEVPGLMVLHTAEATRLVVGLAGVGADGVVVGRELRAAGVEVELADRDWLIPVVTLADTEQTVDRLVTTLLDALTRHTGPPRLTVVAASWSVEPEIVIPPREAFFARAATLPVEEAIGRVSVELVAPYPPGVPVLAPGERITAEAVASLQAAAAAGTRIAYAADPSMATLRVVA